MWRGVVVMVLLAGCAAPSADAPVPVRTIPPPVHDPTPEGYETFDDVDPYTSEFFIALEEYDLVETQGERRTYNLALRACERLDRGGTFEYEVDGLMNEAKLGDEGGALLGAAVAYLCPHHRDLMDAWMAKTG